MKNRTLHLSGKMHLTNKDVYKMLHICYRMLQDWRDMGKIPFIGLRGRYCIRNRKY